MRIKQISVIGLFGVFEHVIPLNLDERITIVHGPNGFGKTAILRLLNGFFNSRYSVFRTIPFNIFRIDFDTGSSFEIIKTSEISGRIKEKRDITFSFSDVNIEKVSFDLKNIKDHADLDFVRILEDILPDLEQLDSRTWIYHPTNELFSLKKVIDRFQNLVPLQVRLQEEFQAEPEWIEELQNHIHVRLIESQRLLDFFPNRSPKTYNEPISLLLTVSAYSEELAQDIRAKLAEYGTTSQSLDRTFPARVMQQKLAPDLTDEQLREQLDRLERTRLRLIEVGLLDKDENSDFQIQAHSIDESTKNILSVYVEDVEKKLSVFNEIASKIDLLKRIINSKFAYSSKEMNFNKDKGFVFTLNYPSSSNSETLSPSDLSSGEQHELVLLYELLFKVQPGSLVLIDEPELSLHVGWQVQFLKDLQEVIKLADIDVLMATHSPDIIQDRWDLTVELKGAAK